MRYDLFTQHTIRAEVRFGGTGLHSGAHVHVRLRPAPPDHGVVFYRVDVPGTPAVPARYDHVVDTSLATVIGKDGVSVSTVEHFMAAVRVAGLDNLRVEIDGVEMPVLDGSAKPFLEILQNAGVKAQRASKQCLRVQRAFMVSEGDAYIKVFPSDVLRICYTIDFPHPLVGRQALTWSFDPGSFARDVASARTFGFLRDVESLQSRGLALGGSLENAVVFDDLNVLNPDGLRYRDECVRHKVLDFVGDLGLCPFPVFGSFEAYKAGHALHNRLLRALCERPGYVRFMPAAAASARRLMPLRPNLYWKPPVVPA
ncbi:UDP-3-O-[3-hydroxymyristoyl] N-acetylglucosamine deacetylase [Desulfosoma caldarium]|uniref:UDP-3-O-acyl-N-acetylglucosamine deacetylase n=1 Tax=Desulfosoma caldarium TaxID=610254 RepID=A0A3N1VG19_9BACT|nr:UDP-3-O-[3-hydroxymyristoyl] N-acetylglucosamine deacetylase [Desulfosoma caldarium]